MAYEEALAERMRELLKRRKGIEERKMFGGLAFLVNGHMACGVQEELLVLRLGNSGAAKALRGPHARPMDFTGKPIQSMVYVEPAGCADDEQLASWMNRAVRFARSLPPKRPARTGRGRRRRRS